ncbi:hypothetical protein RHGRI_000886 [Rhododendron griersonianum]|uniref:Uncharacterized protein n=1 Tax=Rhododendron griersonianum TaxID=479676 RepID=A0AAV6LLR3_9ERIC|nr:hypothetical protein RHGRI_000886 [Rhododendron griersonianum]
MAQKTSFCYKKKKRGREELCTELQQNQPSPFPFVFSPSKHRQEERERGPHHHHHHRRHHNPTPRSPISGERHCLRPPRRCYLHHVCLSKFFHVLYSQFPLRTFYLTGRRRISHTPTSSSSASATTGAFLVGILMPKNGRVVFGDRAGGGDEELRKLAFGDRGGFGGVTGFRGIGVGRVGGMRSSENWLSVIGAGLEV